MSYPPPSDPNQQPQYGPPVSPVQPGNAPMQPGYGQPAYGQPVMPQQPVQKSKAGPILLIIGIIVAVICIGCGIGGFVLFNKASDTVNDIQSSLGVTTGDKASSHTVHFEIGGSGTAKVTWTNPDGTSDSQEGASVPWSKDFTTSEDSMGLVLSAVSGDGSANDLSCKIVIDGKTVKEQTGGSSFVMCTSIFVS